MNSFLANVFAKKLGDKISYKEYQQAIEAHTDWKFRLIRVIHGRENLARLSAEDWGCPHHCALGKWLNSDENKHLSTHRDFLRLVDVHTHFHQQAAKTLQMAQAHQGRDVMLQLSHHGDFEKASMELIRCLHRLHRSSLE